jgi:ribosomal-protein-alanine N-acetyltransferase
MIFRPMILADLDRVVSIEMQSMPSPWSRELFEEELKRSQANYFVIEEEGILAGYIGYWEAPEEAHIITLAIAPSFRNRGLGKRMMDHFFAFAARKGARLATLEVREGNEAGRGLYEKCGFRMVAIRKKYYSDNLEDAVVMIREIVEAQTPPFG